MHKKTFKRNTLHSLTQKAKVPENSLKLRDYEDSEDESSEHLQLPSLQKKKLWKDSDDCVSTWDGNSTATHMSYSSEMENIATCKVMQQWEVIENTLYEDGEQVTQTALLEECIQWRTQIPHLRIIGKNLFLSTKTKHQDLNRNSNQMKHCLNSNDEEIFSEHDALMKEGKDSTKHKLQRTPQDKIIDILFKYVMSELFPNKENEIDSLGDDLNEVLQIRRASIRSDKSSAKSTKFSWFEETIPLESRFPNTKNKPMEGHVVPIKKGARMNIQDVQKKYNNFKDNDRIKSGRDAVSAIEDKLFRPHTGRNKLGTVFNEKIVVSPVPYILSTRESFSTVKTTPIKYMGQTLNISTFQGSSRNISYLKSSGKCLTSAKVSNYQSAWHASVSPTVWPKNIKLAPLDTSRLSSSNNRSLTSSVVLQRSRKPLSPISRSPLPASAQTHNNNNNEGFVIQGKQIIPGQSSKVNVSNTGWDYAVGNKTKKKKGQLKAKS